MPTIFIRTVLFYFIIILSMRLTGKRQVGQLELSELVTAFMLSELASIPIADSNIPFLHGVVPILTIITFEVFISFLCLKFSCVRKFFDGNPSALIKHGIINKKAMYDCRISFNELLSAVRLAGVGSVNEVDYVYLEPNGNLSIILKKKNSPLTPEDTQKEVSENGISHSLIIDSKIIYEGLADAGKSENWLYSELDSRKLTLKDVFYFSIDDGGNITVIRNGSLK